MKHYLVDTNVVIDMILDREDADAACAVFDGAKRDTNLSPVTPEDASHCEHTLSSFVQHERKEPQAN